jgi:hypothetical protein
MHENKKKIKKQKKTKKHMHQNAWLIGNITKGMVKWALLNVEEIKQVLNEDEDEKRRKEKRFLRYIPRVLPLTLPPLLDTAGWNINRNALALNNKKFQFQFQRKFMMYSQHRSAGKGVVPSWRWGDHYYCQRVEWVGCNLTAGHRKGASLPG